MWVLGIGLKNPESGIQVVTVAKLWKILKWTGTETILVMTYACTKKTPNVLPNDKIYELISEIKEFEKNPQYCLDVHHQT